VPDEWTVSTLHEHLDQRLDTLERTIDRRFDAMQVDFKKSEAVRDTQIAEAARDVQRRLEGLNELRQEVTEDRGLLVQRNVFDAKLDAMDLRLGAIETWRNRALGVITMLALGSGGIGAFVGWILRG